MVDPFLLWYDPASHAMHVDEPCWFWYSPAGQFCKGVIEAVRCLQWMRQTRQNPVTGHDKI